MYTIVKGGTALGENWEREVRWVPFSDLVREEGTARSFIRIASAEAAAPIAAKLGGRVAEVLVQRGGQNFEIVLNRPIGGPPGPGVGPAPLPADRPRASGR